MKRIGKPPTAPFVIRRDGTLLDRETRSEVGQVIMDRETGWTAYSLGKQFLGHGSRTWAAERAWRHWREAR